MGGGGVDGAIHTAGGPKILEECQKIVLKQGRLPTGKAIMTTGGDLPAKYVIHTVGPIWQGGMNHEPEMLASAYEESLSLAEKNNLNSISFPSISTGAYGYPLDMASKVAVQTVISFLNTKAASIKEIIFVLFDIRTLEAYLKVLQEEILG
jgi:O-acetyl-ADP-ribose deacetylase (regulator of RNase III)